MWTSTPCRSLPSECTCSLNGNAFSHESINSHLSPQHDPKSVPDLSSTKPLQPLCTCLVGSSLYQQNHSPIRCLCSVQRQVIYDVCCEGYTGRNNRKSTTSSAPYAAPSDSNHAHVNASTDCRFSHCRRALFVPNFGSSMGFQPNRQLSNVEARVPTCDFDRHVRYAASCTCQPKRISGFFGDQRCTCDDLVRNKSATNPSACINANPCDVVPHSEGIANSQLCGKDLDGSIDVLKWQQQHMQHLAVQKSDVLGRHHDLAKLEVSSSVCDSNLQAGDNSSENWFKDGSCVPPEKSHVHDLELVEVLTNQIAELQTELKQERMKVELYESLFKQTQDELENLRTLYRSKPDYSRTGVDVQSCCIANAMDRVDSDVVSAGQASDESAIEDVSLNSFFKWPSNNLDSTDEGVGSEQQSMENSSRLHDTPFGSVSSRNNCNVHSLRRVLKELSSCYDQLLETNLSMRSQLKASAKQTQKGGAEKLLFKELHGSYAMLTTVVELCDALLNNTRVQSPNESPVQPVDVQTMPRDVFALRRRIEDLHRSARERLVTTRFKPTSWS